MLTRAAEADYFDFINNVTSNVVTGNTVETKISLRKGANRNTVVNNVAFDYGIAFSTDVSDNIVESNGAVRLSHGSREQTD
jgi:hypothetical protein